MNNEAVLRIVNGLRPLISGYCSYPERLTILVDEQSAHREFPTVIVHPHVRDYGRIIGTEGRFIHPLLRLFECLCEQQKTKAELVVKKEPLRGEPGPGAKVPFDPRYDLNKPWHIIAGLLQLHGCSTLRCRAESIGEVRKLRITIEEGEMLPDEVAADIRTLFTGFGRFQGIGDLEIEFVQPFGGRSRVAGGTRDLSGPAQREEGKTPC